MSDLIQVAESDPSRLGRWLAQNDIDPTRLARKLFNSVFRQIFEDNLFHADMHPGNVVLLRHGRLAVIDCRNLGSLEAENLAKHQMFLEALADGELSLAAELFLFLAMRLPLVDVTEVKAELMRVWRVWEKRVHIPDLPLAEKSLSRMMQELNDVVFRYGFESQWWLAKLTQTWANLDASLEYLDPQLNYLKRLRRYLRAAHRRAVRAKRRRARRMLSEGLTNAVELPQLVAEYALFQQTILRRQAQVLQGATVKIAQLFATACGLSAFLLALVFLLLSAALLQDQRMDLPPQLLGSQIASLVDRLAHWGAGTLLLAMTATLTATLVLRRLQRVFRQRVVRVPEPRVAV
jgi:ubiquinone biosynthesis protein